MISQQRFIPACYGGELEWRATVRKRIGVTANYCDPHRPWQLGGDENGNSALRRDLPRHADFSNYEYADIVWLLNSNPRKCFGFRTPLKAFAQKLGVALEL